MNTTLLRARDIKAYALSTLTKPDEPGDDRDANRVPAAARPIGTGHLGGVRAVLWIAVFLGLSSVNFFPYAAAYWLLDSTAVPEAWYSALTP